jgi:hypothetical protein
VPELESRRFSGTITDASGNVVGEARMWGAGERGPDGSWTGWIRVGDLGGQLPPGRYTVTAVDGWQGQFEAGRMPASRVFETELLSITGIGPPPWPAPDDQDFNRGDTRGGDEEEPQMNTDERG